MNINILTEEKHFFLIFNHFNHGHQNQEKKYLKKSPKIILKVYFIYLYCIFIQYVD